MATACVHFKHTLAQDTAQTQYWLAIWVAEACELLRRGVQRQTPDVDLAWIQQAKVRVIARHALELATAELHIEARAHVRLHTSTVSVHASKRHVARYSPQSQTWSIMTSMAARAECRSEKSVYPKPRQRLSSLNVFTRAAVRQCMLSPVFSTPTANVAWQPLEGIGQVGVRGGRLQAPDKQLHGVR